MITHEATFTNLHLGLQADVDCLGAFRYVVSLHDTDADEMVPTRREFADREAAMHYAKTIVA